jgi:hypothetical protein
MTHALIHPLEERMMRQLEAACMLINDAGGGEGDKSRLGLDHDILTSIFLSKYG